jgi:hypothetical protein
VICVTYQINDEKKRKTGHGAILDHGAGAGHARPRALGQPRSQFQERMPYGLFVPDVSHPAVNERTKVSEQEVSSF